MGLTGIHHYVKEAFGGKGSMAQVHEQARVVEAWVGHPLFKWGENQSVINKTFGLRAGPGYDVSNLVHEMAHCIQLEQDRHEEAKGDPGWGLRVRTIHFPGHGDVIDPLTTQCSEREAEVMAIQGVILEYLFGVDREEFIEDMQGPFTWLPDYILLPRSEERSTWNDDPVRRAWVHDRMVEWMERWSDIEEIRSVLHRNMESIFG